MQQDSSAAYYVHATDASSPNAENQGLGETEKQLPPCHQLDGLTQAQIDICLVFRVRTYIILIIYGNMTKFLKQLRLKLRQVKLKNATGYNFTT